MKTGEGKTLVATMPVYLNALTGQGVHVVTVNDYLARRDAEWMGRIYRFLGLTVGCIQNSLLDDERQAAYACDVTYGTNNEFGFDYLRDNMKFELESMVQRGHVFAIVDEVDSILIDEARTPLIISGPVRREHRRLLQVQPGHPAPRQGRGGEGQARQQDDDRRLPGRREVAHGRADRRGRRQGREAPRHRQPVRAPEHRPPPRGRAGAARPRALQARRRLHDQGRPGPDRRRVHRARAARAAAGPTACTRRSRPRRTSRSSARTRRSRRSRSRTTSASTRSSPA